MKFKNPWVSATQRLLTKEAEHALYEKAANDIELNNIHKGIWTKAFSLSEGDEQKQKAKYIELMVEYYKDLILAGEELEDILATEEEKRKKAEAENKQKEHYEKVKAEQKKAEQQKKEQEEIERLERVKHMKAFKKRNQAIWNKKRKDDEVKNEKLKNKKEEDARLLQTDEGEKYARKKKILIFGGMAISLLVIAFSIFNKNYPKHMTYECGSGADKTIVYIDSKTDGVIRNLTTGRNAYSPPDARNEQYIVYVTWQSITGEGFMYKVDTGELGQVNPNRLCIFLDFKRHF
jgi:flagellar biosynthesis GTPase FlhF